MSSDYLFIQLLSTCKIRSASFKQSVYVSFPDMGLFSCIKNFTPSS